jgi:glycosyltransferase involved in cell wall biosynthesis
VRICVFNWRDLAHPASGGAEVYTEQVLRRWVAAGHDVTLVAAAVAGRPADELVDGYHVVRRGSRLGVYGAARRWWSESGRGRFDLVIDTTNTVPFFAHEWVDDGARVIGLFHQTCEEIWRFNAPPVASTLGRHVLEPSWLRRYRDVPVLAVSDSTRDALARFGVDRVEVVPEGFEPPTVPVDTRKEDSPTLVFCARMVPYKRPQDVVEAVGIARREMPDLRVWMIGGGDDLDALRRDAPSGVEYLGRVPEDEKLRRMAAAHGHVATSIREGWGLVVSEAAAVGTPTIAYDAPGLRDSTRAAGGVLVPADPRALGRWIPKVLPRWIAEPPEPLAFGGAQSWDVVAEQVLETADRCAETPQPARHRGVLRRPGRTAARPRPSAADHASMSSPEQLAALEPSPPSTTTRTQVTS